MQYLNYFFINVTENPIDSHSKLNTQTHTDMYTKTLTQELMHFLFLFSEIMITLINLFIHYLRKSILIVSDVFSGKLKNTLVDTHIQSMSGLIDFWF